MDNEVTELRSRLENAYRIIVDGERLARRKLALKPGADWIALRRHVNFMKRTLQRIEKGETWNSSVSWEQTGSDTEEA